MINEPSLAEVLESYAIETQTGNDIRVLRLWVANYPQFAAELMDFAAARAVARHSPDHEFSPEEEKRHQASGLTILRAALETKRPGEPPALPSLIGTAREKGLTRKSFAAALGLSVSLVQYLEKRRLEFATIPRMLVARIAGVLETGEELVAGYLDQPPVAATSASYKAAERPAGQPPKSFAEAVRTDQQLSDEEKRRLLELK